MSRKNVEDIYPLSPLQQGILFHSLVESGVYFVQHQWTLEGPLDVPALLRAFQDVVDRHPVLRTAFVWERRNQPVQVVRERARLPTEVVDLRNLPEAEQAARIAAFAAADRAQGFELTRAPLMRVAVLQLSGERHRVVWSSHHLLLDGWSTPLVTAEIVAFYNAHAQGQEPPRLPRPRPYAEYIGWLQKQRPAAAEAFFRAELRGFGARTPLGVDHPPRPLPRGEEAFDDRRLELPEAFAERVGAFARRHQITASTLLQAAWGLVLARYSGEEDVVFGVTVSGRSAPVPGIEAMVGLFINTLAVRVRAAPDARALDWLQGLQKKQADLRELEHTSLIDVQGWSEVPRGTPLFESVLVLENYPFDPSQRAGMKGVALRPERTHDRANLPLTVVAAIRRGLSLRITYDRRRFDDDAVERMLGHLATVLEALVDDPDRRLGDLPLLPESERREVLQAGAATASFPVRECLHRLFEAQVDRTPDAVAATCEGASLTYRALDAQSNRLAHRLRALGAGQGVLVALATTRTLDMLVGILGILKAGAAYLPLDPDYPPERLSFMMADASARVLLTDGSFGAGLTPPASTTVLHLDQERAGLDAEADDRLEGGAVTDLAYVIYTSGSTGKPKGVMVTHANVARLFDATRAWFGFDRADVWTMFHSHAFDFSVWEIWGALLYGGRVVVVPRWVSRAPDVFYRLLGEERVTMLSQTPSAFRQLVRAEQEAAPAHVDALRLRCVVFGGEALDIGDLRPFWERHGDVSPRLVNMYGITETTVHVTYRPLGMTDLARPSASVIGRPIPDLEVYVLDAQRRPVPFGVAGELYVGGAGVARGYLNRPELTAERFVDNPFASARLYKTGDLARRRADGDLEYLGRIDHQVKIRGFRIELGEIESTLGLHPSIRSAVVLAREDTPGDRRLVAYVVPAAGTAPAPAELRGFLRERLPEYMVPSAFVVLDALPLTESGKLDRRALPAPGAAVSGGRVPVPPRGPIEEALAGIFAETLGLDPAQVGAHDGFFELGGHSLLATSAVSRIRAAFAIDLPLRALFETPTPAELAEQVQTALAAGAAGASPAAPPLVRRPQGSTPVLSFAQERLWFLAQLEPDDPSYNIPLSLRLEGKLDTAALERALAEIVRRHEVLRTALADDGGHPVARVLPDAGFTLHVKRLDEAAARAEAAAEARRPFDLASGHPIRATLLDLGEDRYQLLLTMHHAVSDGWSLGVLYRELGSLYGAFSSDAEPPALPDLPIQYADYAAWQRAWLSGEVLEREMGFWRARLAGAPRALDVPADRPRPPVPSHRGGRVAVALGEGLVKALRDLSRREGVTLFMTLLAAFDVLLHRYTGQTDLVVGTPIAGRTRAETEALVGFFVNTLVLRTGLSAELPFRELLGRVKEASLAAFAHQDVPFEELVRVLEPDRDPSRSPLFQVSFTLQSAPAPLPAMPGLAVRRAPVENTTAKVDLTLALFEGPKAVAGVLEYAADLFDAPTADRMAAHFVRLAEGIAEAPDRPLFDLPLLPEAELSTLITTWNATAAPWPEDATLHEVFEAQTDRAPDAPALVFEDRIITYGALDRWANRIAHRLGKLGVGPRALVGISMPRSPGMIAAMLGTVKAGAAWVPLDPAYPKERLDLMLEDSGARVVLTAESVALDALAGEPETRPAAEATAESAAYVIYTSGSTGRPKGVVVEHRGVPNVAEVHHTAFGIGPGSRVLQFSSMSFDASVWETVMALLNGAALVLAPQEALLPGPDLARTLAEHRITALTVPPSVLAALPFTELPSLDTIVVAGEACSEDLVDRWAPGRHFWDAYGPTETTICASMGECFAGQSKPSIGKPIANARIYVLDPHLRPVPIGVPGELCAGGVGLARGYLNRPELTAQRFVTSPFDPGERLYRTGDLARWRPDGTLEFLGRIDFQLKLRGFRIEPGEIDAVLRGHPGVADAITVARDERLVAYVVPADEALSAADLRRFLETKLPAHMVPAAFVTLATMPLNPSGKVDRAALPAPATQGPLHTPPRGPVEEAIAGIFAEVLRLDPAAVGAHDGFFELGGHSLVATAAVSRIRGAFAIDLPLRALFEAPTVAELAGRVQAVLSSDAARAEAAPPLARRAPGSAPVLSFAQERLWFLAQLEPDDPSYNIPLSLRLEGKLDTAALERALAEIVRRHEVLRTALADDGGRPVARVFPDAGFTLHVRRADEAAARTEAAEEARRPFDLASGQLIRATLLDLGDDRHQLLLTMHHAASDGWSMGVLYRELGSLYGAFSAGGEPPPLSDLPIQYADYAAWQRAWLSGEVLEREIGFWQTRLAGAPRALDMLMDRPRPPVPSHHGGRVPVALGERLAKALRDLSRREGVTLFMTLLAAFDVLLHRYTGQTDLVVGTPIAGRTRVETESLIGLFVNTLVLRARLSGELPFRALLAGVKEACLTAFAHQDVPFEELVRVLEPDRDPSRSPLFQVSFTLQAAPTPLPALPGLAVRHTSVETTTAKFDLTLALFEGPAAVTGVLEYATDLFDGATVERMAAHFRTLVEGIAEAPDRPLRALPILPESERRQLVAGWNATAAALPAVASVHELVRAQAARAPTAPAVASAGRELTYGELQRHANQLAHWLRARGVGPDVMVALVLERSIETAVAMLGVLEAGGAYVALDPAHPRERLRFAVEDAGAKVLLTHDRLLPKVSGLAEHVLRLDADWPALEAESDARVDAGAGPEHLAYVVYTSGSTGLPKGVELRRRGLLNLVAWHLREHPLGPGDRAACVAAPGFDAATFEVWPALAGGATLVVPDDATRGTPEALAAWLVEQGVTVTFLPTPLCEAVMAAPSPAPRPGAAGLRLVTTGGDRLSRRPSTDTPFRLLNMYGPAECTVVTTTVFVEPQGEGVPPIGRPLANMAVYVLDAHGELVPIGVPGELYIGGEGLGRGYLKRPELTAERFVPDPFGSEPGARLYRTGDRVRWLADGTLAFLGRLDHQVKLRGFRIELAEIEAVLVKRAGVREAAVAVREDVPGQARLVAYVVPEAGVLSADELRRSLAEMLPEYMVPSAFVWLDALPLTENGKLDRRALPAPEIEAHAHVAPRGSIEETIAAVFGDVLRLGTGAVGAHDGFFALGGHSLLAAQAIARLRAALGVEIPLRALFEAPTPAALATVAEAALAKAGADRETPLVRVPRDGPLALSFAQERMWFLDQLQPGDTSYVVPIALQLSGVLDAAALARALSEIVGRHEVLRTTFRTEGGKPVLQIHPPGEVALPVLDLAGRPDPEAEARREAAAEARTPFDLARDPALRARLLRLAEREHVLLLSMHHIVADGWTRGVLVRELSALYGAFSEGRASPLPELPIQYADHAAWQRRRLQGEVLDRQLGYWKERLAGAPRGLDLPADRPRPQVRSHAGGSVAFEVSAATGTRLDAIAGREGATLFMTLLAAFDVLLHRLTGQRDLVVGAPVAGRGRTEIEGLVGFFSNTLVLRTEIDDEMTFVELVRRVREICLGAYAHQDVPFERLVQEVAPERDTRRTPLFEVTFTLQNAGAERFSLPGLQVRGMAAESTTAKFDLSLSLAERPDGALGGAFEFATDLFDRATAQRLAAHLVTLLDGIAEGPGRRLWELPILDEAEREQLLRLGAGGALPSPAESLHCVHERFEEQVDRAPDAVAVVCEGRALTYAELDRRANRVAAALRARGVGPETLVGLCAPRSIELVAGLLGILKAGGAYVPLDPDYPKERVAFMVEDAGAAVVVAAAEVASALPDLRASQILLLDGPSLAAEPAERIPGAASLDAPAYVIYTSGSTGRPKGVVVTHRNVARLFDATAPWYGFGAGDVWTLFHSYAFDFSVWEMWGALLYGGRLVVVPYWVSRSADVFHGLLAAERVTVLNQTPSAFRQLVQADARAGADALALRYVIFGGEALDVGDLRPFWERHGDAVPRLVNMYGITETTVHVTYRPLGLADSARPWSSNIGVPIPDLGVLVLDAHGQPVPIGVTGEMYVGGAGVARGYLRRPELTAERFVSLPFPAPGGVFYKTGDLARRLASGELEYLGRADQQVKLRGFRIELGEIEAALEACPGVREAVVVLREDAPGDKRLVAYLVGDGGAPPDAAALRALLRQRLPEHMVPAAFVALAALPLGPTGKIDRRALPAPDADGGARAYVAPRGPVEEALAGIFAEVLGVSQVGAHDGFFELGGHSLVAAQAIARVRGALGADIPLRALFEAPSPAELALRVEAALREGAPPDASSIARIPRGAPLEPSFGQERLWVLHQLAPDDPSYVVPLALRLDGPLDAAALGRALREIATRHEVLRTTFATQDGRPALVVHDDAALPSPVDDLRALPAPEREARAREAKAADACQPFDLARGPVIRARLLVLGNSDHLLLLSMHHAVADAWSERVLLHELSVLHDAFREGLPSPLPALPIQYADFAAWQRRRFSGALADRQLAYWRQALAGAPRVLDLPADRPRPPVASHRGGLCVFELPASVAEGIDALGRREGTTLFMTLLAAFFALLYRHTGQDDLLVGTPVANRGRPETEGLIGFFLSTLVLRARVLPNLPFRALLASMREACLGAYAHQDMPFERLVQELDPERDLGRSPLFQVLFTVHDTPPPGSAPFHEGAALARRRTPSGGAAPTEGIASKFDLTLGLRRAPGGGLVGSFEYATDLFDASTVERMAARFSVLCEGIAREAGRRVRELPLLPEPERRALAAWNNTAFDHPGEALVHQLFAEQARRTPDAVAVSYEGHDLTYGELASRAGRLAEELRRRGVGPEVLVGVCMERSVELLIALHAVLLSGGAYVPLDPEYPKDRLAFMLADARPAVILTQPHLDAVLPEHDAVLLHTGNGIRGAGGGAPVEGGAGPGNLAYVIYTSGSTGRPKGAMNAHRGIQNRLLWMQHAYGLTGADRVLQKTPFGFDVSVWELFWPLMFGARLVVARPGGHREPAYLAEVIASQRITTLHFVPSMLRAFLDELDAPAGRVLSGSLRRVVCSGEALPEPLAARFFASLPGVELHNLYGPTEAAVDVTASHVQPGAPVTLGRPVHNTRIHVLDASLVPVPVGVRGELYIAGVQVGRGYLRRPDLTAERFVCDPFETTPGARMYRTGDVARWLPSGEIEYLGRADFQVKVRGFRIELGEIEATLLALPSVREAVVVAREEVPGRVQLVAYLVAADASAAPGAAELRGFLLDRLPDAMVPAVFVYLPALPLTSSGKVDRRALPAPGEAERAAPGADFVAPVTEVEEALCSIWAAVLRVDRVGVRDNFFEIGGDSILGIQIVARAQEKGIHLSPRQLFQHPTVAALAAVAGAAPAARAEEGPVTGPAPLTPVQRWWLEQDVADRSHWNQSLFLEVREPVDAAALAEAVAALLDHHDALRLRLEGTGAGARQRFEALGGPVPFERVDLAGVAEGELRARIESAAAAAQASLDLATGPVFRAVLFDPGGAVPSRLLLVAHHMAVDGVSWRVILGDLWMAYGQRRRGEPIALPPRTSSFKRWAVRLAAHARSAEVEAERAFWLGVAAGGVARLPVDHTGGEVTAGSARNVVVSLSADDTADLLRRAPEAYGTQINDLLLAALAEALMGMTGSRTALVDLEGHGREDIFDDLDLTRTVGWFTAIYPVAIELPEAGGAGAAIKAVKEQLRAVPERGVGHGLLRYLRPGEPIEAELRAMPEAEVSFNYLGQLDQALPDAGGGGAAGAAPFGWARESAGPSHSPRGRRRYVLDVTASVSGGRLAVQWTYSEARHVRATIEALADRFLAALRGLVAHCLSPEAGGYTASDFQEKGLSQSVIDMLAAEIDDEDEDA